MTILEDLQVFTGQLQDELRAVKIQRDALLEVVKTVEWIRDSGGDWRCPWCGAFSGKEAPGIYREDHLSGCPRQAAIAMASKTS